MECLICMDIIENDELYTTRCNHHYHSECFTTCQYWSKEKNKCPYCRQSLIKGGKKSKRSDFEILEYSIGDKISVKSTKYNANGVVLKKTPHFVWVQFDGMSVKARVKKSNVVDVIP